MGKLILHIGATSGRISSQLNDFCKLNRTRLREQGIYRPANGEPGNPPLLLTLVRQKLGHAVYEEHARLAIKQLEELSKLLNASDSVLLSCPFFLWQASNNPGFWDALLQVLKPLEPHDIHFVVWLPRPDIMACDLWEQLVLGIDQEARTIDEFLDLHETQNYLSCIELKSLRTKVDSKQVHVYTFDHQADTQTLTNQLLSVLGNTRDNNYQLPELKHKSTHPDVLEIKRTLNRYTALYAKRNPFAVSARDIARETGAASTAMQLISHERAAELIARFTPSLLEAACASTQEVYPSLENSWEQWKPDNVRLGELTTKLFLHYIDTLPPEDRNSELEQEWNSFEQRVDDAKTLMKPGLRQRLVQLYQAIVHQDANTREAISPTPTAIEGLDFSCVLRHFGEHYHILRPDSLLDINNNMNRFERAAQSPVAHTRKHR